MEVQRERLYAETREILAETLCEIRSFEAG